MNAYMLVVDFIYFDQIIGKLLKSKSNDNNSENFYNRECFATTKLC